MSKGTYIFRWHSVDNIPISLETNMLAAGQLFSRIIVSKSHGNMWIRWPFFKNFNEKVDYQITLGDLWPCFKVYVDTVTTFQKHWAEGQLTQMTLGDLWPYFF